ncbi:hypothetical protein [Okeania sp. KiyG1]|uniref:hypothetical protein n=1 Tax=Okeania sp. KiyG1 TaxID=2720165 RepID=UPI001921438B|nr:hypothetical protein [Okeania sp. KiyG1]
MSCKKLLNDFKGECGKGGKCGSKQEKQRAEQEKQRAEQEKQRAEKLATKLRDLGVDPNSL